ncbi:MFS transporter, DHA1 family, bicyclomycin/chloramphenicol resistance protein [Tistlia consotensis]|uniref:MFS transporter, DHA1 family, bicyclomycin/chloramphenicol resistance protein n=1 Tax=Tistlia consotensis USBA 355 TaxID=560819 RepID=A0A1Y6CHP1_9PROT|nr:MFS transporter [Tistlia consotensis]SMF64786.1 MFS transporter, DHA1 family, bicyclomycin/chloramphenicol resistance protein [Tistlia consotensis USBA 355]SNR96573.1 MFS transporter, DHA1 family, bicyclomycin/chloramphenicol resistance protein [Tistlia consotensis]
MTSLRFIAVLGALTAVSATAVDIMIPAQPEIGRALAASPAAGAALVTGYLLGYGPGQLFWGPLSDRYGRLKPLYFALAGFLAASAVCALAGSLDILFLARLVQGATGGGAPVIARAIARDQGGGPATATLIARMTAIMGLAPLVAPAIGSGVLALGDWRQIFWLLAGFSLLLLLGVRRVLDGPDSERRRPGSRAALPFADYLRLLGPLFRAPEFYLGTAISSSAFLGYAGFLAVGATVAEQRYGVSPEAFGLLFAFNAGSFILGSFAARLAARRLGREAVLLGGAAIALAAGIGLGLIHDRAVPTVLFWSLLCLYLLAFGILLPSATAMALEPGGGSAGLASSLIGAVQVVSGALGTALAASGFAGGLHSTLCLMMAGASAVSFGLALLGRALLRRPAWPAGPADRS